MIFLPEKKYGVPSHNFVKKMFCAKKVTKLPDLTVPYSIIYLLRECITLQCTHYYTILQHYCISAFLH